MIHTSKKELINLFKFLGLKKEVTYYFTLIILEKLKSRSIYDCAKKIEKKVI